MTWFGSAATLDFCTAYLNKLPGFRSRKAYVFADCRNWPLSISRPTPDSISPFLSSETMCSHSGRLARPLPTWVWRIQTPAHRGSQPPRGSVVGPAFLRLPQPNQAIRLWPWQAGVGQAMVLCGASLFSRAHVADPGLPWRRIWPKVLYLPPRAGGHWRAGV